MKRRILKAVLFALGALSTLLAPLASLPSIAKAQSCGWGEVVVGWVLERVIGPTITPGGYYGYCGCAT